MRPGSTHREHSARGRHAGRGCQGGGTSRPDSQLHRARRSKNVTNPQAHYETTGPEIWRDLGGNVDYFVAGAGSGGTYTGVARYLKEKNPEVVGVLADPVGSTMGGGEHGDYDIEGIGNDFVAKTMDMSLVDQVIKVTDNEAFSASRLIARAEGIFAGSSSGAALSASLTLAGRLKGEGKRARHHRSSRPRATHLQARK